MSYGKYVLLTIEEHQDLIARLKRPEDRVDELLKGPLDNDSKVAHLRSHLTNIVQNRLATVEEPPERMATVEEPPERLKTSPAVQNPKNLTRSDSLPADQTVPTPQPPTTQPPTIPTTITPDLAKSEFLKHINKHPNIFQVDKQAGTLSIHGQRISIHNINRIAEDISNKSPLTGVQPTLIILSEELKKSGYPERYILNPKRKYKSRTSPRSFSVKPWKQVVDYLHSNDTYTRHYPKSKSIQHNLWVTTGPDSHHMADLAMLPTLKSHNKGFCYILVVVDVFSRYVFARPLKNKECATVTKAYDEILKSKWRIPTRLYTDKGTEFMGKQFRKLCSDLGIIHQNPKNTNVKACYAENAIMRIKRQLEKWFTTTKSYEWTRILPEVVDGLNTAFMTSLGTTPEKVIWKNAPKIWNRLYGDTTKRCAKFKIGDTVRILLDNGPFAKGTRAKWTEEIFKVIKIVPYDIPVYILADTLDREVDGIWYEEEMVLYNKSDDFFEIDKVIRKRTRKGVQEYFVSFKGYDSSFNSWVPADNFKSLDG
ncbi:hypothetical protein B9Z55_004981 [Caenorhabditis nigoni]|uniref:Integrase catalytic domain-containing protein n=1 Tax=Caenorhabditis nigoni TaxID=1611254 RepID=A0A2G5UYW7_9PELO|nr:hypothetical protein B9Z55_004981 [Caenorhabditis nigoni]